MMNTLYIIGNGFDRYHGLDTRYQSFALFLKSKHNCIYEMFTQYYGLPDLDENDKASLYDPLWADFENALAKLDFQSVLEDNTDYLANPSSPDFRDRDWNTYQIEMEMIVDKLTKDLYKAFKEFILAVEFPENIDNKILDFKNDSAFLNFNYTDTLEQYYFIKASRILYIHGKAKNPGSILVLGHGREPSTFKEEVVKEPNGLSEEELKMWRDNMADEYDYSYELGKGELMSYFNGSFKSTQEIIQKNQAYFYDLKNVKEVFVLGHSVSEIDQPYFKSVIQGISDKKTTWTITYYSGSEHDSHLAKLIAVGLDKSQINLVKMETLKRSVPTLF